MEKTSRLLEDIDWLRLHTKGLGYGQRSRSLVRSATPRELFDLKAITGTSSSWPGAIIGPTRK